MKTLTVRDQEIHKAQMRIAEARGRMHSLAPLGAQHPDYQAAGRELDDALAALAERFQLPEEYECAFCPDDKCKFDGEGRVVITTIHVAIKGDEGIEEFEYSAGNPRHIVLCPTCAAPLTRKKETMRRVMKPVKAEEDDAPEEKERELVEVEEPIEVRAIAEYFNRR